MEVNVYFNGPATEIDMGPREFSIISATGPAGADGTDGVGIVSIVKTGTSGLVDTYTVTMTDGSTSTFTVKNGQDGEDGQPGRDGTIENLDVEATTLPAGSQATASYENNLLTLGIPQGAKGDPGDDGQDGVGVPSGGTTGQVLKKKSGTDYDTEWGNATGGTWGSITGTLSNQTDLQNALNGKLDTSKVYNGLDQTSSGYALDARQGKALSDAIPTKTSDLNNDSGFITGLISGTTAWYLPAYSLNSFSGKALTNILNDWAINVPTGYSLLANVEVSIGGAVGLTCHFDGANEHLKIKPNIYIYNAKNTTVSVSNDQTAISVISLFIKN